MKTHLHLVAALVLALFTGCASSGKPKSVSSSPAVKLPPLGKVGLLPSAYRHEVRILEPSKGMVFRQTMDDGAPAVKAITDSAARGGGAEGGSLAIPVVLWHGTRAVALTAFTGTPEAQLRTARDRLSGSKAVIGIQNCVADMLRTNTPPLPAGSQWLATDLRGVAAAREAGADTAVEIEVLSLGLKRIGGAWGLRGQAMARVVRVPDQSTVRIFTMQYTTSATQARPLPEWTTPDAKLLRSELSKSAQGMAADLSRQLATAVASR
jgi:hypothetical protein